VYRSGPDAPSPDILAREFDRLASQTYAGIRDGGLDPEVTFDLASFLMDWAPSSPAVRQLAEQSMTGTDPARLADLAAQVLADSDFEPGFAAEPRRLAELERALKAVQADMHATGLAGPVRLVVLQDTPPRHAFAEFRGSYGHTSGVAPDAADDPVRALIAVADDLQDAVMAALGTAWPVCLAHGLGGHPREHDHQAVWWCSGRGGHVVAMIGTWSG
jgi:hypothetical protein